MIHLDFFQEMFTPGKVTAILDNEDGSQTASLVLDTGELVEAPVIDGLSIGVTYLVKTEDIVTESGKGVVENLYKEDAKEIYILSIDLNHNTKITDYLKVEKVGLPEDENTEYIELNVDVFDREIHTPINKLLQKHLIYSVSVQTDTKGDNDYNKDLLDKAVKEQIKLAA